ncbi:hypothetical protein ACWEOX_31900, partial [Streptomyces sp. NPDC004314]
FDDFKVVPPGTGIVHQVNIEHLARTVTAPGPARLLPSPGPAPGAAPLPARIRPGSGPAPAFGRAVPSVGPDFGRACPSPAGLRPGPLAALPRLRRGSCL